jgi:hypothetical protein
VCLRVQYFTVTLPLLKLAGYDKRMRHLSEYQTLSVRLFSTYTRNQTRYILQYGTCTAQFFASNIVLYFTVLNTALRALRLRGGLWIPSVRTPTALPAYVLRPASLFQIIFWICCETNNEVWSLETKPSTVLYIQAIIQDTSTYKFLHDLLPALLSLCYCLFSVVY